MAIAYAQYLGNGSTKNFNVNFPYISRDHVQVKVNGVPTSYTWLSSTTLQLPTAPAVGAIVDVRRVTPRDTLLVDFVDGSTLVETDLDLSALQVFYLAQEAFDLGEASLGVTEDGSFSALNRRISNILNPTLPQDAATKWFVENAMTSQVVLATDRANAAAGSASAAAGSASAASGSASAAASSAGVAETHKNAAGASASAAATSATTAEGHKNAAAASALAAANSASEALGYRNDAAGYAAAAAQSASDAALFDPSSYYIKSEIDSQMSAKAPLASPALTGNPTAPTQTAGNNSTRLATTAFVQTAIGNAASNYAPASHSHTTSDISDFSTKMNTKMDKAGGSFTGAVGFNSEVNQQVKTLSISSGNITINLAQGNRFKVTLTENATLQVSNLPPSGEVQDWTLEVVQDSTGGRTLSASSSFVWPGESSMPAIETGANKTTVIAGYANNSKMVAKVAGGF